MNDYVVAERDSTSATTGSGAFDTVVSAGAALERGDWLEGGLLSICGLADSVSVLAEPNPLQALMSAGIGWLMERIRPVHEWLDQFAGNPDAVVACAQTWHNVGGALAGVSVDYAATASVAVASWQGAASAAYTGHAATGVAAIGACGAGTGGVASAMLLASSLVTGVRAMIRGVISDIVAYLLTRSAILLSGIGTAPVLTELAYRVATGARRIADVARRVWESCERLAEAVDTVSDGLELAATTLSGVRGVVAPATRVEQVASSAVRHSLGYDDL